MFLDKIGYILHLIINRLQHQHIILSKLLKFVCYDQYLVLLIIHMSVLFDFNAQQLISGASVYRSIIDTTSTIIDSIVCVQPSDYFGPGELKEKSGRSSDLTEVLYASMLDLAAGLFSDLPKELSDIKQVNKTVYDINIEINNIIQEKLLTGVVWDFDLKDRFLYIALLNSIRNCHKLIGYLVNKITDKKIVSTHKDSYGNTLIMQATLNIESLIELLKIYPKDILFVQHKHGITPLNVLIANGSITTLIDNEIITMNDLKEFGNNNMNIIHLACLFQSPVLQYFINHKDLDQNLLKNNDINSNTPIVMAAEIKYHKAVEQIIKCNKFTMDAIDGINYIGRTIFHYGVPNLFEMLLTTEKLTDAYIIKNYDSICSYLQRSHFSCIEQFMASTHFKTSILCHSTSNNGLNIFSIMLTYTNIIPKIVVSKDDSKITILKEAINLNKQIMVKLIETPATIQILLENNLLKRDMLIETENDINFYKSIITNMGGPKRYNLYYSDIAGLIELLKNIVKSEHFRPEDLKIEHGDITLLYTIGINLAELIPDFIERKYINPVDHGKTIIKLIEDTKESTLFKHMIDADLVTMAMLNNDLLLKLIINPEKGHLIMNNYKKIMDPNFLKDKRNIDTINIYLDDLSLYNQIIDNEYFSKEMLNSIDILLISVEKLKIILDNRRDFERTKLYNPNMLETLFTNNKLAYFKLILDQHDAPYINYESVVYLILININQSGFDANKSQFMSALIDHKYFCTKIFELKHNGNNILHSLIEHKYDIATKILESKHLTREIFIDKNNLQNNILHLSICHNKNITKKIISHQLMDTKLVMESNLSGKTVLDLFLTNFDADCMEYIIANGLASINDITKSIDEHKNTYIHLMAMNGFHECMLKAVAKYENNSILLNKNIDGDTPLHLLFDTDNTITFDEFNSLGLSMRDLMILNNENEICLVYLSITNKKLGHDILENYGVTKELLTAGTFFKSYLTSDQKILDYINDDILIDRDILIPNFFSIILTKPLLSKILDKCKYIDELILLTNGNISFSDHLMSYNPELITDYFEHKNGNIKILFTNNMKFLTKIILDMPELFEYILKMNIPEFKDIDIIQHLIKTSINSKYYENDDDKNTKISKSFYLITKSKYLDIVGDKILDILKNNQYYLEYLIKNSLIKPEMLLEQDKFGDPYIMKLRYNMQSFDKLLTCIISNNISNIINKNKNGQNILHLIAAEEYFDAIISDQIDIKIIMLEDNFKKTCIDYLIEYKNEPGIEKLFNSNLITKNILLTNDRSGRTLFSKILQFKNNSYIIGELFKHTDNELLAACDIENINNMGHVVINSNDLLATLIREKKDLDRKLFDNIDNNGRTCLMLAAQYNSINMIELLDRSEYMLSSHFMVLPGYGSCLTKIIKYNPSELRYILESKLLTDDILYSREEDNYNGYVLNMNIVQLACKHNPEALMLLFASKYDLYSQVEEIIGKSHDRVNSLKLAILYQPEAVDILLKSKYGNNKLIKETNNIMKVSCLIDSLTRQPSSFQILLKSGKMTEDDIMYKKDPFVEIQALNSTYPLLHEKSDINKAIPLMKHKNEKCEMSDPHACNICSDYKANVIFTPCNHTSCVTCALRLDKCHMCRNEIIEKLVVY